jgi:hypothetical protein
MQFICWWHFELLSLQTKMVSVTSEAKQWGAYTLCGPHHVNNSKVTTKFFVQGFMNYEFLVLAFIFR